MNSKIDDYLFKVGKAMFGMDRITRNGILTELRTHLEESLAEISEPHMKEEYLVQLEPPKTMAGKYKQIYGYSRFFNWMLIVVCTLIGIVSIPTMPIFGNEPALSVTFILAIVFVGMTSYLCGMRIGILAGMTASAARIIGFFLTASLSDSYMFELNTAIAFAILSLTFIIVGYGMGKAKEIWKPSEE